MKKPKSNKIKKTKELIKPIRYFSERLSKIIIIVKQKCLKLNRLKPNKNFKEIYEISKIKKECRKLI